jgi:L-seryl-tRNA(Ser) seleniumtransferase
MSTFRRLPSVDRVLSHPRLSECGSGALRRDAVREVLQNARALIREGGEPPTLDDVAIRAATLLARWERPSPTPVINATGVILHTNLGRAPLSDSALAAMQMVGRGYSDLEFDLAKGERGSRFTHLEGVLRRVTGAEAGIAVNNNASAILLMLSALCSGREVVVSRGQAVEIGGGFRIPDVLRQSGATLVEVGTTNRTNIRDFADAITEHTAAILRVHASNFRVVGFTTFPELDALAALAHDRGVLLLDDLGSGCLLDTRAFGMMREPMVQESIAAGVDVAAFSGDKLLGGPQAGILAGRRELVEKMRRHPLARAVRMDKTSIAALAATLQHYLHGEALTQVPIWRMIATPLSDVEQRARAWAERCPFPCEVRLSRSMVGGGSLPEEGVPTWTLAVPVEHPDEMAFRLRRNDPPIVARVEDGALLLDPRTVDPRDDDIVSAALSRLGQQGQQQRV